MHYCNIQGEKCMVFVNLGPCRCVLIREVSSFQGKKCMVFLITWGLADVSSLERCPLFKEKKCMVFLITWGLADVSFMRGFALYSHNYVGILESVSLHTIRVNVILQLCICKYM